jgi:predicted ATPase
MREVAYDDIEHDRVMRDFLNHRAAMLRELMRQ